MTDLEDMMDREQLSLLQTPAGTPGSGKVRYAAAMHFYNRGNMSAELLENYRICANLDGEDPLEVARHEGVAVQDITLHLQRAD